MMMSLTRHLQWFDTQCFMRVRVETIQLAFLECWQMFHINFFHSHIRVNIHSRSIVKYWNTLTGSWDYQHKANNGWSVELWSFFNWKSLIVLLTTSLTKGNNLSSKVCCLYVDIQIEILHLETLNHMIKLSEGVIRLHWIIV